MVRVEVRRHPGDREPDPGRLHQGGRRLQDALRRQSCNPTTTPSTRSTSPSTRTTAATSASSPSATSTPTPSVARRVPPTSPAPNRPAAAGTTSATAAGNYFVAVAGTRLSSWRSCTTAHPTVTHVVRGATSDVASAEFQLRRRCERDAVRHAERPFASVRSAGSATSPLCRPVRSVNGSNTIPSVSVLHSTSSTAAPRRRARRSTTSALLRTFISTVASEWRRRRRFDQVRLSTS